MKKRRITREEVPGILRNLETQRMQKWYSKWHSRPWAYALVDTLIKLPLFLVVIIVLQLDEFREIVSNPGRISGQLAYLLVLVVFFIFYERSIWNRHAVRSFLLSRQPGSGMKIREDTLAHDYAVQRLPVIERKFNFWKNRKFLLIILISILVPVVFVVTTNLINSLASRGWSWNAFIASFEGNTFVLVNLVFVLLGVLMGFGIWRELKGHMILYRQAQNSGTVN